MTRDLLICAAIDFAGQDWFSPHRERMTASLTLGKAGDIRQGANSGAWFAARQDILPGGENPRVASWQVPMQEDGSVVLLAGRLMERDALADRLGLDRSLDDAALYDAAFRSWGEACDREIVGEYAAIQFWPGQCRLRLSRSPLRAPPLHLWRDGSRMVVSSIPRTIFAAGVTQRVDEARLADLALFNRAHPEHSLYEGLARVPCGSIETHDPSGSRTNRWWRVEGLPASAIKSAEDAISAVSEQFTRAAKANLADVSGAAISLSGGLDSQTSASFLLDALDGRRLRSFTSVPVAEWLPEPGEGLIYDESPRVKALAEMYPALEPQFIEARDASFGEDIERMFLLGGWPTYNEMNMHWVHAIYRAAAGAGSDVIFNADMGDAGFSYDGLAAFPSWLKRGRWFRLARELRARSGARSLLRRSVSLSLLPLFPPKLRQRIDEVRGNWHSPFETWCPLDPESAVVREAIARTEDDGHHIGLYQSHDSRAARAKMIAPTVSEGPEVNQALRLLHGVETRDLTAFRPLFELCAGLPDQLFMRNGTDRWLARRVSEGRIPPEISRGTKVAIQSADFLHRAERDKDGMLASLSKPGSSMVDTARLSRELAGIDQPGKGGPHAWLRLACALPRGVAFTRFVQYVEGRNDG